MVKLGELFSIGSSKRVLKSQWRTKGVPFYRGREITRLSKEGRVDNDLFIDEDLYSEFKEKYGVPAAGDIMVTAIGTIGNPYIVKEDDRFYFKDASVLWLKRKSDVDSKFVDLWLKSPEFKKQLEDNGTTVNTLTIGKLQSIEINLPSIEVQRETVKKLDEVFEAIDVAKKNTEKNLQNVRELFESELKNTFSKISDSSKTGTLGDICDFKAILSNKNIPYVGMEDVEGHTGRFIGDLTPRLVKSSTSYFDKSCVLYGKLRPYLNKVLVPDFEGHCSTEFVTLRPDKNLVDRNWLGWWLKSPEILGKLNTHTTGTRMPRANLRLMKELEVNIPVLEEQREIVKKLEIFFEQTQKLQKLYQKKLNDLEELRQSYLKQAFSQSKVE